MSNEQKLREAVFIVLEGFTLDYNVRKILEAAYYRPEALATTEPEPFDEREAFEKWLGIKPCGAAHDFGWSAWQARAALREKELNK